MMKKLIAYVILISSTTALCMDSDRYYKKRKIVNRDRIEEINVIKNITLRNNYMSYYFLVSKENENLKNKIIDLMLKNIQLETELNKLKSEFDHLKRCKDCLQNFLDTISE